MSFAHDPGNPATHPSPSLRVKIPPNSPLSDAPTDIFSPQYSPISESILSPTLQLNDSTELAPQDDSDSLSDSGDEANASTARRQTYCEKDKVKEDPSDAKKRWLVIQRFS